MIFNKNATFYKTYPSKRTLTEGGFSTLVRTHVCVQGDFLKRFRKSPALCGASLKCLVLRFSVKVLRGASLASLRSARSAPVCLVEFMVTF